MKLKILMCVMVFISLIPTLASARDLGFRYHEGKCQNADGKTGLNPSFLGQCGDLRGAILQLLDFSDLDFQGSRFDGANLQKINFSKANLQGVNFDGAIILGADFVGTQFKNASFVKTQLKNSIFSDVEFVQVNLTEANFTKAQLSSVKFSKSQMYKTQFNLAQFENVQFVDCELVSSQFDGVVAIELKIMNSNIEGANFQSSKLSRSQFQNVLAKATAFKMAKILESKLANSGFTEANFQGAELRDVEINDSQFIKANLRRVNFRLTKMTRVELKGATFSKSSSFPFSNDEAEKLGMIKAKNAILILKSEDFNLPAKFVTTLEDAGAEVIVAKQFETQFDGAELAGDFGQIFHLNHNEDNIPQAGQKEIVKFVRAGGRYLTVAYSACKFRRGLLEGMADLILHDCTTEIFDRVLTVAKGQEQHPYVEAFKEIKKGNVFYIDAQVRSFAQDPVTPLLVDQNANLTIGIRKVGDGEAVSFAFGLYRDNPAWADDPGVLQLFKNVALF